MSDENAKEKEKALSMPEEPQEFRRFFLVRHVDVTGYSGPGVVAQGIQFNGMNIVLWWCVPGKPSSIVMWTNIDDAMKVHGHDGATTVRWID